MAKKIGMLAYAYREHEGELRADLQQYYGIDLDRAMAGEHTAGHLAELVRHLPDGARVRVAIDPDEQWTPALVIDACLYNAFASFVYGLADKKRRGRPPDRIGPSWMRAGGMRKAQAKVMTIDELRAELSKPRVDA